jgi:Helix-turn-helix domain
MGRPEEPLSRDGTPVREFAFWLRDLRRRSGLTYEQLGRQAHYATSTVQAAAAGQRLPTLRVAMAVVRACGGDERAWREYWSQIWRVLDADVPTGVPRSVTPPWQEGLSSAAATEPGISSGGRNEPQRGMGLDGWFVESLTALVRLDADPVEVMERRTVVATDDALRELVTSVSVPRYPGDVDLVHELEAELLYGGVLLSQHQPYDSHFQHVIELPRALRRGERHDYAIRLWVPLGQPMAPHYLHTPFRRSDHFELRVRFDQRCLPSAVWLLRDAPPAVIYQTEPGTVTLVPDRCGEVSASFHRLRPGLGYGVRWRESDQKSPRT